LRKWTRRWREPCSWVEAVLTLHSGVRRKKLRRIVRNCLRRITYATVNFIMRGLQKVVRTLICVSHNGCQDVPQRLNEHSIIISNVLHSLKYILLSKTSPSMLFPSTCASSHVAYYRQNYHSTSKMVLPTRRLYRWWRQSFPHLLPQGGPQSSRKIFS
jgi:hypothetical protein